MALRVRDDGRILCAALHVAEPGDTYLHDGEHSILCIRKVIVTEPMSAHAERGEWWVKGYEPSDVEIEPWWYE